MTVVSFSPFGFEGSLVTIEVDLRRGIPAIDLVGLADNAVKESRERMRAAIRNSGFEFPLERVLISLSPADVKKEGAGFDLAIALAVLSAKNPQSLPALDSSFRILVMGELELSGRVRPVRGIHAAVSTALEQGISVCIVPKENEDEASCSDEVKVIAVENLCEAYTMFASISEGVLPSRSIQSAHIASDKEELIFPPVNSGEDFEEIKGLPFLVRGLQIAAAGAHNLMTYGPPGCGKTLALQKFPSLLPELSLQESRPVTRIYSLAGCMENGERLIRKAPFRVPHQSATLEGLIGGGLQCRPGEVSLAHNGVLFLDEASEFRTTVLQSLRVPLEEGRVTLSRAGRHTVFPAQFQLLLASNPCPCGNFGVEDKICVCPPRSIELYWKKFSSPLLDRIDIRVPVLQKGSTILTSSSKPLSSSFLRTDIERAVAVQRKRQGKRNARLHSEEIAELCPLSPGVNGFLKEQSSVLGFSSRAVHSCIKLARTIADMRGGSAIRVEDMEEAVLYRKNEGGGGMLF